MRACASSRRSLCSSMTSSSALAMKPAIGEFGLDLLHLAFELADFLGEPRLLGRKVDHAFERNGCDARRAR